MLERWLPVLEAQEAAAGEPSAKKPAKPASASAKKKTKVGRPRAPKFCLVCMGEDDVRLACARCHRGYHMECAGLERAPEGGFVCEACEAAEDLDPETAAMRSTSLDRDQQLQRIHRKAGQARRGFLARQKDALLAFVDKARLDRLAAPDMLATDTSARPVSSLPSRAPPYLMHGELRYAHTVWAVGGTGWLTDT